MTNRDMLFVVMMIWVVLMWGAYGDHKIKARVKTQEALVESLEARVLILEGLSGGER